MQSFTKYLIIRCRFVAKTLFVKTHQFAASGCSEVWNQHCFSQHVKLAVNFLVWRTPSLFQTPERKTTVRGSKVAKKTPGDVNHSPRLIGIIWNHYKWIRFSLSWHATTFLSDATAQKVHQNNAVDMSAECSKLEQDRLNKWTNTDAHSFVTKIIHQKAVSISAVFAKLLGTFVIRPETHRNHSICQRWKNCTKKSFRPLQTCKEIKLSSESELFSFRSFV